MTLIEKIIPEERQFLNDLKECLEEPIFIHRKDSTEKKNSVEIIRTNKDRFRIAQIQIRENKISEIPKSVTNLKLLQYLIISGVDLPQIPNNIFLLHHLESLSLINCGLRASPGPSINCVR